MPLNNRPVLILSPSESQLIKRKHPETALKSGEVTNYRVKCAVDFLLLLNVIATKPVEPHPA
jgi:hypothetical protein